MNVLKLQLNLLRKRDKTKGWNEEPPFVPTTYEKKIMFQKVIYITCVILHVCLMQALFNSKSVPLRPVFGKYRCIIIGSIANIFSGIHENRCKKGCL
jgi:hypothetical protein